MRAVDINGIITTLAGDGGQGSGGDAGGGNVTNATGTSLGLPYGCAVDDDDGLVYFADRGADCVRAVDIYAGEMWTVAGTGASGDAGDGGPATAAQLYDPEGVALSWDGFTLFIADNGNSVVRCVGFGGSAGRGGGRGRGQRLQRGEDRHAVTRWSGALGSAEG